MRVSDMLQKKAVSASQALLLPGLGSGDTVLVVVEPLVERNAQVRKRRGAILHLRDAGLKIGVLDQVVEALFNAKRPVKVRVLNRMRKYYAHL
jgi:hypothetical protein